MIRLQIVTNSGNFLRFVLNFMDPDIVHASFGITSSKSALLYFCITFFTSALKMVTFVSVSSEQITQLVIDLLKFENSVCFENFYLRWWFSRTYTRMECNFLNKTQRTTRKGAHFLSRMSIQSFEL